MNIRTAKNEDLDILLQHDKHISKEELAHSILSDRVYILENDGEFTGWLRWNLFWDNTPFMNMLYILDGQRAKGYGRELVLYWEQKMRSLGYGRVMTSTASDEYAQHFYVKMGYKAIGGFTLSGDVYEMIFEKLF